MILDETLNLIERHPSLFWSNDMHSYRVVKENGVARLQRAFEWCNGNDGGVDWRTLTDDELEAMGITLQDDGIDEPIKTF